MRTIKDFVKKSHISEALICATIRQMGGWESFKESALDVCDVGADAGFGGFIYHVDTVAFAKKNKGEIVSLCKDLADGLGTNWLELIASFNCLDTDSLVVADVFAGYAGEDDTTQVYNALAWFALEEIARSYCDLFEF